MKAAKQRFVRLAPLGDHRGFGVLGIEERAEILPKLYSRSAVGIFLMVFSAAPSALR